MNKPKYAVRFARLPRVFEMLAAHPDGVPLVTLADEVGAPADELREDLLAFFTADPAETDPFHGLARPSVLEFLGDDGVDVEPAEAVIVRSSDPRAADEIGVSYVDASELALVHTAATVLAAIEPDPDLEAAIDVLAETMQGEPGDVPELPSWNRDLPRLQSAQQRRNVVRITYSRSWEHGVTRPREIHPYRLVQTRRGWEVDAGPPDERGKLRTYLLSGIRDLEVLEEDFALPDGLVEMLAEQRATTTVRVVLPHEARWAADMYAERVRVAEADDDDVTLDLELLEPLDRRVGMLLLAAGPDAFVVDPPEFDHLGATLAEELLLHHQFRR